MRYERLGRSGHWVPSGREPGSVVGCSFTTAPTEIPESFKEAPHAWIPFPRPFCLV